MNFVSSLFFLPYPKRVCGLVTIQIFCLGGVGIKRSLSILLGKEQKNNRPELEFQYKFFLDNPVTLYQKYGTYLVLQNEVE